jgi:AcrR family transcriptional regulator
MAVARPEKLQRRSPLTRERVLKAAVRLADREGIDAVSMRRLGTELGIEAMSLYTHIRDKGDLLNGMVELVIREIPIHRDRDWKSALRRAKRRPPPPVGPSDHRDSGRSRAERTALLRRRDGNPP